MSPRRTNRWILFLLTAVFLGGLVVLGVDHWKRAEMQRKADTTEWRWSAEQASLDYCAKHNLHGYTAQITPDGYGPSGECLVSVLDGTEEARRFRGHEGTVFVQVDDTLYVADYSPIATGCQIVAYDLSARKELWRCWLKGNPPHWHSKHTHRVNMEVDGDSILVFGNESNGRYIEYVDRKNGRTVGHKKLPPDYAGLYDGEERVRPEWLQRAPVNP